MAALVFMFSGQGSQHLGMGADLIEHDEVFRGWMLRLDELARRSLGGSVLEQLARAPHGGPLSRTLYAHPAIFMVEVALVQALAAKGIAPDVVLGVSLGEYAAAACAGVWEPEDALEAVIRQAQLLEQTCAPGGMLAVLHEFGALRRWLERAPEVELAGRNGATHCVLSGPGAALRTLAAQLGEADVATALLPVERAFHSTLIDPAEAACVADLSARRFRRARLPLVSSVDGESRRDIEPQQLWSAVRAPMAFTAAVERTLARGACDFVDVGPSSSLAGLLQRELRGRARVFSILSPFRGELERVRALQEGLARPTARGRAAQEKKMLTCVFPGQGAQRQGMGAALFPDHRRWLDEADEILGYSVAELCLENPGGRLAQTQYTQPALFVVNALAYMAARQKMEPPACFAGHSLGEYNALWAAGCFDFATGVRLVKRRGELMAAATGGGMAAVIGLSREAVEQLLGAHAELASLDIANVNTPRQVVLAGPAEAVQRAREALLAAGAQAYVPLNVSAAFHSRYMAEAAAAFGEFLAELELRAPHTPVISNVTARPYPPDRVGELLALQIMRRVDWQGTVESLMAQPGFQLVEVGPSKVLTSMMRDFSAPESAPEPREVARPAPAALPAPAPAKLSALRDARLAEAPPAEGGISSDMLGSAEFCADYGIREAYVAGAMYRGIASVELVVAMGRAGSMGYFGAGGLPLREVEAAIRRIQAELSPGQAYGMNLLCQPQNPQLEEDTVDLYLRHGVHNVEAASYMVVTPALVRYRLAGLQRGARGEVLARNRVMGKVSRPEVAEAFLRPAPARIVKRLLEQNRITREQAELSERIALADDLCVESDSGGHTDQGVAYAITPTIARLRDRVSAECKYPRRIRVGAAGGIGTPEAAAAAFMLGADFILTGSINQCTVEAGTHDAVKDLLEGLNVQDFDYAPAGDLFELGARVQVVKKGLFFPARANKLYELYRFHDSVDSIDAKTREHLEKVYFGKSFEAVYDDVRAYFSPAEIEKAESVPKYKMALIFKWYFGRSSRLAMTGASESRVDYQVHSGPALGAFNQWVKGTRLESWRNRHVAKIGALLMAETAQLMTQRFQALTPARRQARATA